MNIVIVIISVIIFILTIIVVVFVLFFVFCYYYYYSYYCYYYYDIVNKWILVLDVVTDLRYLLCWYYRTMVRHGRRSSHFSSRMDLSQHGVQMHNGVCASQVS